MQKIYLLAVRTASNEPSSSAVVRLFLPYVNNIELTKDWDFTIATSCRLPELHEADIVIIQRDAAGIDIETISNWLKSWRAAGKKCVLELDDDFFDANELYKRTHSGKWTVSQIVASVTWLAMAADAVITSTPHLKKIASKYNKNVFLLPNYLDPGLWGLRNKRKKPQYFHDYSDNSYDDYDDYDDHSDNNERNNASVKIGYIGTATHDGDLAIITEVMNRLEHEYGDKIQIEVIGAFQKRLNKPFFGQAVALGKNRQYSQFVKWLRKYVDWDIAVIPLEDNHFNKSKSHLKYLECSALKLASICSDVSTYSNIVENNKNGLLVKNNREDWYQAIKYLIENPSKREQLAQEAYDNVTEKHTTYENTEAYQQLLQSISTLPTQYEIPELPYQSKNFLEKILIKRWGRYNRLWSKLLNDPHYYFADSRHGWLRPLRFLFSR